MLYDVFICQLSVSRSLVHEVVSYSRTKVRDTKILRGVKKGNTNTYIYGEPKKM